LLSLTNSVTIYPPIVMRKKNGGAIFSDA